MGIRLLAAAVLAAFSTSASADHFFQYYEAESAPLQENTAYRDQGFTNWMGHPSNGRTVIFGGASGLVRFDLSELPSDRAYWVHVRQLAFPAPQASVEALAGWQSLGVTSFAQPGTYLAWSEPLGPFTKRDGTRLTLRPAEGNTQAPYVDVVLVTDKEGFVPDNMDQDYASLVLKTGDTGLEVSGYEVRPLAGECSVGLRAENQTEENITAELVLSVTDPVLQERSEVRQSISIAPGEIEHPRVPFEAEAGRTYTIRAELRDGRGSAFFFDTRNVEIHHAARFEIDARALSPGEAATVTLTVIDPKLLAERPTLVYSWDQNADKTTPIAGEATEVSLAADALGIGRHRVTVGLEGNDRYGASFPLSVIPWPEDSLPDIERVTVEGQVILVNGSPFVPRKLHHAASSPMVKRQGFNAIDCWGGDSLDEVERMLDQAHAANLYGYGVLFHEYFYKGIDKGYDLDALREGVARLKHHPALLMWELYDEPDAGVPVEQLMEAYELLRELDPDHPVILNFCYKEKFREYAVAADIVSMDTYPIPARPVTTISEYMDALGEAVDHGKPTQVVLQTYGGVKGRMPTPEELRCMTYLAINHGARSTAFYSYAEGPGYPYCLNADPVLWSYVRELNAELQAIMPEMAAPSFTGTITVSDPRIDVAARELDGQLFLIAVNTTAAARPVKLTVPGAWTEAEGVFTDAGDVAVIKGDAELRLTLPALEGFGVRVLRIR